MSKHFDVILDECIDRILSGASVEDCLARYPEYAADLEPHCRVAAQLVGTSTLAVSAEAKNKGRLRLQEELRLLEQRDGLKRARPGWKLPSVVGWRPRWAMALATVLLAFVLGGAGVAASAGSSLPGDLLYPVKQATEQARLTMQFSDAGKATLHLSYAQRRAEETSALVQRGDTAHLEATLDDLNANISAATHLGSRVEDKGALAKLRTEFESHSLQTLAVLQEALESAPEGSRTTADASLKAASQAYGEAVETVAPRSPSLLAASPGTLRLLATDPPPPDVEKVLVRVGEIRVKRIEEQGTKWHNITIPSQTFDLLKIAQVQTFLAEQQMEAGTYTKIRFSVESVSVVVGGVEYQAKIPGEDLVLTRPFQVQEGKTTTVLLDFNGLESLRALGSGDYLLTPQVKVLVQTPRREETKGDGEKGKDRDGKDGGRDKEESQPLVEIGGTIESKSDGSLVVRGKEVVVSPDAEVKDKLEVGGWARVTGVFRPDGTFEARKVEVEKKGRQEEEREKDEGKDNSNRGPGQEESGKGQPSQPTRVELEGMVESAGDGTWVIAGRTVVATRDTEIRGQVETGVSVRVAGTIRADGTIVAERVVVRPIEDQRGQKGKGDGGQGGDEPERPTPTPTPPPQARSIRVTGTIEAMGPGRLTVAGKEIIVDAQTRIDGQPALDLKVEVEGEEQPGGAVVAKRIVVLSKDEQPKDEPRDKGKDGDRKGDGDQNKGETRVDPTPTPTRTSRDSAPVRDAGPIRLIGPARDLSASSLTVAGRQVVLTAQTRVVGTLRLGMPVEVLGQEAPDGKILATSVVVLPNSPDRTPGVPPVP